MWSLFAVATEDKQRCIVFLGEELQAGGVFERVNGIFLRKADAIGALESVEVCEEVLNERRAGSAAEEKGTLWVFGDLRCSLLKCSLRPCIFGLSIVGQRTGSISSKMVAHALFATF